MYQSSIPPPVPEQAEEQHTKYRRRIIVAVELSVLVFVSCLFFFATRDNSSVPPPTANLLGSSKDHSFEWLNEPTSYTVSDNDSRLVVHVPPKTDYWRKTYYGFVRDSGPFFFTQVTGNFVATVKITGNYHSQFDQAGIMLRESPKVWMKCGIEYTDSVQHASTVITRDVSDWSVTTPIPNNPESIFVKVQRKDETIETFYSLDGETWSMMRLGYLSTAKEVKVGMFMAAPSDSDGFDVTFEEFSIGVR